MAHLNKTGAKLMHRFNAHAATDVTGFGILGHAKNLAANQKEEVSFVLESLPILANMTAVAKASPINFKLFDGYSAETSGIVFNLQMDLFFQLSLYNCLYIALKSAIKRN